MSIKDERIYELVAFIFWTTKSSLDKLAEVKKNILKFDKNTLCQIFFEFLAYNIHQVDRLLFIWYGEPLRSELFNGIFTELLGILHADAAIEWDEKYKKLSIEEFNNYIDALEYAQQLEDFPTLYNNRTEEYSKCSNKAAELFKTNNLPCEFVKKIEKIVGVEDKSLCFTISLLSNNWLLCADDLKRQLKIN